MVEERKRRRRGQREKKERDLITSQMAWKRPGHLDRKERGERRQMKGRKRKE